jgi:hypothetical protein
MSLKKRSTNSISLMQTHEPVSVLSFDDLPKCQRVVVKCGTAIVNTDDGHPSLSRMAQIVEQVSVVMSALTIVAIFIDANFFIKSRIYLCGSHVHR